MNITQNIKCLLKPKYKNVCTNELSNTPVFSKTFILTIDASQLAIWSILCFKPILTLLIAYNNSNIHFAPHYYYYYNVLFGYIFVPFPLVHFSLVLIANRFFSKHRLCTISNIMRTGYNIHFHYVLLLNYRSNKAK